MKFHESSAVAKSGDADCCEFRPMPIPDGSVPIRRNANPNPKP